MLRRSLISSMVVFAALAGCSDNSLEPGQGRIALRLTDAPFPLDSVESIDVFVTRIEAKAEATTDADAEAAVEGAAAGSSGWIVLATPNASFNLMDLQNGVSVSLGDAEIAAGSYRSLRLILDTDQSSV